ncbi:MAG: Holliday junction resolvase RuvX [Bacteroidales bacterium]|nr:Holliday junction resolvase RuvX [Bacteroidales bacterium]
MGRILAIDFGTKRVGLAVSDELKIIASPLTTVHNKDIFDFLNDYLSKETVDIIVVGEPKQMNNQDSELVKHINPFIKKLHKVFPDVKIDRMDERFTSKMAEQAILMSGKKKKDRQNKALVDTVSAAIILQSYMESKRGIF